MPIDLRISDEENFIDLKKRAKKALVYIARRRQKGSLSVTHGIFLLKMLAAYMTKGNALTAQSTIPSPISIRFPMRAWPSAHIHPLV